MRLTNKAARTLSESLGDNRWKPKTQWDRDSAHVFRELLHEAHRACYCPAKGRKLLAIKVEPQHMTALSELGGFPWLRSLGQHEVMMARELFCTNAAKSSNLS